jgi:hypothetical protein
MCTVVILRRPNHAWPLVMAANRDEMSGRPWRTPGRHWPNRPGVTAGLDETARGSWLGVNDRGLVAAMLNRMGTLGPQAGKRSRGELVLSALDHGSAAAAVAALTAEDGRNYRAFNMVVADGKNAFWLRHLGSESSSAMDFEAFPLPDGLSMITARDRNDGSSPRIAANLPRFAAARPPDPASGDWTAWQELLRRRALAGEPQEAAMTLAYPNGFATLSSSLVALAQPAEGRGVKAIWLFAAGPPDRCDYCPVAL